MARVGQRSHAVNLAFRSNQGFHLTAAPVDLAAPKLILAQPQVNHDR